MAQATDDVQRPNGDPLGGLHALPRLMTPARPMSRGEQLAETIREAIRDRGLSAGDFFGTLDTIREETGLARTTVSEAVKLLRDRRVLVVKPGRYGGLFVAKTTPLVRLRHTLMRVDDDPTSVADAIELRETLEELIAINAANHRTEVDVAELRVSLDSMRRAESWDEFMQANWSLHRRIAAICPNSMARAVYESTLGFLARGHAEQDDEVDEKAYLDMRLRVHERLIAAITAGDGDAARAAVAEHSAPRH